MRGIKALAALVLGLASLLGVACSAPAEAASSGMAPNTDQVQEEGAGHFGAAAKYLPQPALEALSVTPVDRNGDDRLDLVTVADQNGRPVAGAQVSAALGLGARLSNAAGDVTFQVPAWAEALRIEARPSPSQGNVEIYVEDDQLENAVSSGNSKIVTIDVIGDLENPMPLTLTVRDSAGNPVSGVAVDVNMQIRGGVTRANGAATVDVPTNGRVTIEARTATAIGVWDSARQQPRGQADEPERDDQDGRGLLDLLSFDEGDGGGDDDRAGSDRGPSDRADEDGEGRGKERDRVEDDGSGHSISISILGGSMSTSP